MSASPKTAAILAQSDLGSVPDARIGERLGVTPAMVGRVRKDHGIARFDAFATNGRRRLIREDPDLGVLPQRVIAERHGVSLSTVARVAARFARHVSKKAMILADPDLGKVHDHVIAERYGCSKVLVHLVRKEAGIPAFGRIPDAVRAWMVRR